MPINPGSYRVATEFQVDGVAYPMYSATIELNAFSFASTLEVSAPIYPFDSTAKTASQVALNFNSLSQRKALVPFKVRLGYADASSPQNQISLFDLETGYLDESTYTYDANEVHVVGRSVASIFQDSRISNAVQKSQRGDQLVSTLFAKRGIPVTIGAKSPNFVGKAYTDAEYLKVNRGRSEWDEMADAALNDGFVFYVHNGRGYYGPPAADVSTPTVQLAWGNDLEACSINHAARRAHNISVIVDSYQKKTQQKIRGGYGPSGFSISTSSSGAASGNGEQFRFFISGLDRNSVKTRAKAIWTDLIKREFIATIKVIPDAAFLQILAKYGANFLVQLSGCFPEHNILYHVKKASIHIDASGDEPGVSVDLVLENHAAVAGNATYL